jgi:hypothetical protein
MEALPPALADARLLRSHVKHQLTHRTLLADFYVLSTDVPHARPPTSNGSRRRRWRPAPSPALCSTCSTSPPSTRPTTRPRPAEPHQTDLSEPTYYP